MSGMRWWQVEVEEEPRAAWIVSEEAWLLSYVC